MTPKQALEHDWKVGEKLWAVYYKYNSEITEKNGFFRTEQPVGVIEVTVTDVERFKASDGSFESVTASITANWGLDEVCYSDTLVRGMVDYTRWGERYSHGEFCVDKFFDKKKAEKRYKTAVNSWNKKVQQFQNNQKAKIEKAKREYERLLAAGVVDANEHTIK